MDNKNLQEWVPGIFGSVDRLLIMCNFTVNGWYLAVEDFGCGVQGRSSTHGPVC